MHLDGSQLAAVIGRDEFRCVGNAMHAAHMNGCANRDHQFNALVGTLGVNRMRVMNSIFFFDFLFFGIFGSCKVSKSMHT